MKEQKFESIEEELAFFETERLLERIDHDRKLWARRGRVEQEIQNYYGPDERHHKSEINEIQKKLDQSGLKGWWFRAWHGKEARQELDNNKKSLANVQWRKNEAMQKIDTQNLVDRDRLALKHQGQRERADKHLKMQSTYAAVKDEIQTQSNKFNEKSLSPMLDRAVSVKPVNSPGRSR